MFDKAIIRANIRDAGFSLDDTCALLEGLDNSKDESEFRSFVTNMRFTGTIPSFTILMLLGIRRFHVYRGEGPICLSDENFK